MKMGIVCLFLLVFSATAAFAFDNVLLISVDTLRADYLSCYGSKKAKTPNIDQLSQNGVLFENVVSPAPFTLPSHVSILTGLIPPVHGVLDNGGFYLNSSTATLSETLKSNGMNTAAFVSAFPLDSRFGMDQGFDVYDDSYPAVDNITEMSMPERRAEETAEKALQWLETKKAGRWFAFVHFFDPHFPYKPPEPYLSQYAQNPYAGEVAYVDAQIGKLTSFLKKNALEKKTLVILTSDHGESLGEHKENTHGIFAYESTLRVPLLFSPFAQAKIAQRVRLIDIAPTIAELQKVTIASRPQGISLAKMLNVKKATIAAQPAYFESLSMHLNAGWAPLRGFYSGNYKFIDLPIPELYDLSADPGETKNLCSDQQLCTTWRTRYTSFFNPFRKASTTRAPIDPETAEQLKALGYTAGTPSTTKKNFGAADDPKKLITFHNRVHNALGFYNKGQDLKALEILEKILEERPDYSVAYEHAAFIRSAIGFPEQAVELMDRAIKNNLTSGYMYGKLGLYLYESGKLDRAVTALRSAIGKEPQNTDHWNYLGMTYTAMNNYREAEKSFRQALKMDPSDASTLDNLGTLYLTQKDLGNARKSFEAAIAANPHTTNSYNGLGVIYASQKDWGNAIANWKIALNQNRTNYDAMLNLAFAYLENRQKAEAVQLLQEFEKGAPKKRYAADLNKVRSLLRQLQ